MNCFAASHAYCCIKEKLIKLWIFFFLTYLWISKQTCDASGYCNNHNVFIWLDLCLLISRKRCQKCITILYNEFHRSLTTCSTSVKQDMCLSVCRAVLTVDCAQSCDMQQLQPIWHRDCLWWERTCSHKHTHTDKMRWPVDFGVCMWISINKSASILIVKMWIITESECLVTNTNCLFVHNLCLTSSSYVQVDRRPQEHTNCLTFPLAVEKVPRTPPETDWMIERSGGKHMVGKRAQWGVKRSQVSVTLVAGEDMML